MIAAAIILAAILSLAAGLALGYRRGFTAGQRDAVHRLLICKSTEMWDAAHTLAIDLKQEPERSIFARRAAAIAPLVLCALLLAGCGDSPAPRGSAQDLAIGAAARADSNARAADAAAVDAAKKKAAASALAAAAKAQPTQARIDAAVEAQVDAVAAQAVYDALEHQANEAEAAASKLTEAARIERNADLAAADTRRWLFLCRCIGLAGVGLGALLGGLMVWLVGPKLGVPVGGLIAGTGLLVVAFGSTITWLPIVLAVAVVVGVAAWAIAHRRSLAVGTALSQTLDAVEGRAKVTVADAKADLADAVAKSGIAQRIERLRDSWRQPEAAAAKPAQPITIQG